MWKVIDANKRLRAAGTLEVCLALADALRFMSIRCIVVTL